MIQSASLEWLVGYAILVLLLLALPAYILWFVGRYLEAVIYNSLRPNPVILQKSWHDAIIRAYDHRRRSLDVLLLSLYISSTLLILIASILLGSIQGLALGMVVSAMVLSHLRYGIHVDARMKRKLAQEQSYLDGEFNLFG